MVICLALALSLAGCADSPIAPGASGIHPSAAPVSNGVSVSPSTPAIVQGAIVQLTASGSNGNVHWSSSDAAVAAVSSSGLVSGVAPGTATITARQGGKWGTAVVTVTAPAGGVHSVEISPDTITVNVGATTQKTAVVRDTSGNPLSGHTVTWSSSNTSVATVNSSGLVSAVTTGTATITATADGKFGTAGISVISGTPSPPSGNEIRVGSFTTQALQSALSQLANQGGGTLLFPAGIYDLRSWPTNGVQVNVPVLMIAEGTAILQGSGGAHLFDFGKQVHIEGLEFRNWLRPIRFYRAADWANNGVNSEYVRVVNSRFYDIAIAIEGRKESGTTAPANAHRLKLLHVTGNIFARTRRVVDFRRVLIDRFEFTHNQVRDVIHRNPEPDVPLEIVSVLYLGSASEDAVQRATDVVIQHNDIRRVRNEDIVNGRAYAILAYRGPTIVENNHIEDVVAGEGAGDGAAAIYQRSYSYARFAHNRVVNGTSTANVAALMAKQSGAAWDVLDNEIIFTDAFKDLHGSPEYVAFEATLADVRFDGNVVRGASRVFVTRMESSNYGRSKSTRLLIRNNTFEECASRPNTTTERMFTIGYRRLLVEVSHNRFIDCGRASGSAFLFANSADNFEETDELRITNNEWIHTTPGLRVPSQVIYLNAFPRQTLITLNRYEYAPANPDASPTPITFVMLPSVAGEAGARVTVSDNRMQGLRRGTTAAITILESRAGLAELLIERNRATSGGNFVRLTFRAPERTIVRNNDVTGISGQLVRRDVEGGELIISGNIH